MNTTMDENDGFSLLDEASRLSRAQFLTECGIELRDRDALLSDDLHDVDSVIWASDAEDNSVFQHVFVFDAEMIEGDDDYPEFVRGLAAAAEVEDRLTAVSSSWDRTSNMMTLRYTFDGIPRVLTFEQANDWIPPEIYITVVKDIADLEGRVRLAEFSGQVAMIAWVFVDQVRDFLACHPSFEPWPDQPSSLSTHA